MEKFLNNISICIYDLNNRNSDTHIEIIAFNINFQYLSRLTLKVEGTAYCKLLQSRIILKKIEIVISGKAC